MKRNAINFIIVGLALLTLLSVSPLAAQVEFSGDATFVSTYVWRGVKQNNGPAMQGTAGFGYGAVSLGVWMSSIDFGTDNEVETDPFVEVSLPTGPLSSSIGATIYSYDALQYFNDQADYEYEIFGKVGYGPLGVAVFFVPSQSSTDSTLNDSDYWVEVSGETAFMGADLSATFGYGTYSSKFLGIKDAVSCLALTAGKSVSDDVAVSWTYSIGFDDTMEDMIWMGISYGF